MKILWGILLTALTATTAQAALFSQLQGTYQVLSCENLGATPSNSVCHFSRVTVEGGTYFASITFHDDSFDELSTLTVTLPGSLRDHPAARYCEVSDAFAVYSNEGRHGGQVILLRKLRNGLHHLSVHLRSDRTKTLDVIEMDLDRLH